MKLKFLLISSLILLANCKKTETIQTANDIQAKNDSIAAVAQLQYEMMKQPTKYSFVEIHTYNDYLGSSVHVTGIFETSEYLSEDEEYRLIDEAQARIYTTDRITKRKLRSFDGYAEASKAREKLLK